ncbi:MAG: ABC transporter permease, partial [Rikenellaceae bacterium]|nr:ABC transporter permease [Rikenellaceae bacterium]
MGLFRRFKVAMILNVLGLSVAFAAFMVIMMQVDYDLRFDSCQPEADNIFRMSYTNDEEENAVPFSRPFSREAFASSPHIKAGAIMNPWVDDSPYYIEGDRLRNSYRDPSWGATAELLDVFDFDMVEGGKDALSTPDALIMPQSMARRLFGEESALGKRLINTDDGKLKGVVCGVFKDFPRNSSMRNIIYYRLSDEENYNAWTNWNYLCFMRLDDASNMPAVVDLLNDKFVTDK